jgi:hypothetical protein
MKPEFYTIFSFNFHTPTKFRVVSINGEGTDYLRYDDADGEYRYQMSLYKEPSRFKKFLNYLRKLRS